MRQQWLRERAAVLSHTCIASLVLVLAASRQAVGPISALSVGYSGLFLYGQSDNGMKLATHLHVVLSSRTLMVRFYLEFNTSSYFSV